jgi:hypothetical protein
MPFKVIRGTFHVTNYSPDGDSIRFRPDDVNKLGLLSGPPAGVNARGHTQLRIEAIDSLETHYNAAGEMLHQPLALALEAAETLIEFVGITNVTWDAGHRTVVSADDGRRGYILSRSVEKNRRPVAFVFAGDPPEADGADVFLDVPRLGQSYNQAALQSGLAYATYYTGLFSDLRNAVTAAVNTARQNNRGVYAADATNAGVDGSSLTPITDQSPIMPKLFRRLSDYIVTHGDAVGFKQALELSHEPVLDLQASNFTHFDTFIEQAAGSNIVKMTRHPEELVFDAMPTRPSDNFTRMMEGDVAAIAAAALPA